MRYTLTMGALGCLVVWLFTKYRTPSLPTDPDARALSILKDYPLIDGHNDFPMQLRLRFKNQLYNTSKFTWEDGLLTDTDSIRLHKGRLGGQFWSIFVECPSAESIKDVNDDGAAVRDTLEQIDVAKRLFERYDEFQYCTDSNCVSASHKRGRLASMLGAEGLHQAGSSIANIRMLYELGVRYCTLTHFCSNAFATSANDAEPGKHDPGLTKVGTAAVMEMNRLGMLVDISHVSFQTMADVLALSQSPVIFSHSGVLELSNHYRNVPDHIIRELPRNGGVLMVAFVSAFLRVNAPEDASLEDVVDHIFHIAKVAGWDHVGLGSDFDGFATMPVGMQDVACYPMLVAAVIRRGATDEQVQKLIGGNILRVMRENERIAARLQGRGELPREDVIPGRTFPINWKPGRDRLEAESVD